MNTRPRPFPFELLVGILLLALFYGGCSSSGETLPEGAKIEIVPGSVLLIQEGEQYPLTARVLDDNGDPLEVEVVWESSSDDVTVDASGVVTAAVDVGSALITAHVGEVSSNRSTVLVVEPVPNHVIVTDAQVVEPPVAVDPSAPADIGTRSTVLLTDIEPPSPGVVILPKEDALVTGRVVASEVQGSNVLVTLEAVPVNELVRNLEVRHAYPLTTRDFIIKQDEFTTVTEEEDGTITVSYDYDAANEALGDPAAPGLKQESGTESKFLNCKSSVEPRITFRQRATMTFNPGLTVDTDLVVSDGELRRLLVKAEGSLDVEIKFLGTLTGRLVASIKCRAEIVEVPVPIGGFLNAIFVTQFPLGIGLDLEGVIELAKLTIGVDAGVKMTVTVGFEYTSFDGFQNLTDFTVERRGGPVVEFPNPFDDLRVNGSLYGYLWSGFDLQALPVLELVGVDIETQLLDVTAGPRFKLDLGLAASQAGDLAYASKYGISIFGRAGLSDGVKKLIRLFLGDGPIEFIPVEFVLERVLFESPKGALSTSALEVVPGSPVDLRVTLDRTTTRFFDPTLPLLSRYAVESVEIFKLEDGVVPRIESIGSIPAMEDQSEFTLRWTPTELDEGLNTFVAFVNSPLFGTFTLPLEVASDSRVTVNVRDADAPPPARFQFLGAFPDAQGNRGLSYGVDVNQQGLVAGMSTGVPHGRAFRWQNGVGLVDLGKPASVAPEDFGATSPIGQRGGINAQGEVVGTFRDFGFPPGGGAPPFTEDQPFVWRNGSMESLNESLDLDEWKQLRTATDINDSGSIIGLGIYRVGDSTRGRGYIWRGGAATSLGTLGTDTNMSYPNAINNSDVVVGVVRAANSRDPIGFVWDGSMSEILPPSFVESEATDINNAGQIVGRAGQANFAQQRAMLYLPEPAFGLPAGLNLLAFPSCTLDPMSGGAHAINESGQILVSTACMAWAIWDNGDLTEIAPPDNTFTITRLLRINDNGQAIGYGKAHFGFPPEEEQCDGGTDCPLLVNFEQLQ